jgi:hypothetical protein
MKSLYIYICFLPFFLNSSSLYEGISFNEQGIGFKKSILVTYHSIGKSPNEQCIKTIKNDFHATSALSFMYKNENYYLSIEERIFPNFLNKIKDGDLLLIDIVVFNTNTCCKKNNSPEKYCAYINKIEKADNFKKK